MKVFASDLDQTLIYSNKWVGFNKKETKCIEIYNNQPLSFMLLDQIKNLKFIDKKFEFIPVTTRTKLQYERIELPVEPKFAVVANGAIILIDGIVDENWEKHINTATKASMDTCDMRKKLEYLTSEDGVIQLRDADNLFLYLITDVDVFDRSKLEDYREFIEDGDWSIYDHGKKVYFIPKAITKGAALKYLKEKIGFSRIVASGDSNLDSSMMNVCDYFIVPGHSKLTGHYKCSTSGIDSGQEIVDEAISYLNRN